MRFMLLVCILAVALVGCRDRGTETTPAASPPAVTPPSAATTAPTAAAASATPLAGLKPTDYSDQATWLCRPGKTGTPCDGPLDQTVISGDGTSKVVRAGPAASPPIDCFYVYPTVSTDSGVNSDLEPDSAERNATIAQAAPFGQVCRLFVPLYRQLTLTALNSGQFSNAAGAATAYGDVVAAWEYYLAHDNNGRGVVLIGHSQGSMVLKRLIAERIDGNAQVRPLLVSAILAGTAVSVPTGKDVGGDFQNIPACRTKSQRGCVITYSTFNSASPPPALSLFGRVAGSGNEALCVNPANLARDGSGALSMWLGTNSFRLFVPGQNPQTAYGIADGLIDASCKNDGRASYLSVSANAGGKAQGVNLPNFLTGEIWGLHVLDVSIAMGNLVELVRAQGRGN